MITTPANRARDSSASRSPHPTSPTALNTRTQASSSPRLSTSSIFERDVQDPSLPPPASPAIPAHFSTENYIPPVLEATSIAITDSSIDPDHVQIVSSTAHHSALAGSDSYASPIAEDNNTTHHSHSHSLLQPSSSTIATTTTANTSTATGSTTLNPEDSQIGSGGGYGTSLAQPDTRRLSFISFADVVQAEHDEASHPPSHISSPGQLDSALASSASSSPPSLAPSSLSAMVKDQLLHQHPHSRGSPDFQRSAGGPTSQGPHGELTVETMTQALKRHGSGDLKALSSPKVHSPSPLEDRNV